MRISQDFIDRVNQSFCMLEEIIWSNGTGILDNLYLDKAVCAFSKTCEVLVAMTLALVLGAFVI